MGFKQLPSLWVFNQKSYQLHIFFFRSHLLALFIAIVFNFFYDNIDIYFFKSLNTNFAVLHSWLCESVLNKSI